MQFLYSKPAYILHTESNDQKNHYALNWRGTRGLNFDRDIWTYRNFGADHIFGSFFFFFCLLISLGADHISEMHLILIQYNIANPKNFRTKALLLGWTRSSYWIMTIHHKSIPTSPSAKFQFVYLKSTLQTQKCSLIIYTKVQMLRTKKQVKDLRVSHTPNPPFFPWGKKEHKTR